MDAAIANRDDALVIPSAMLGATLSQGMGRQTAHLNAFGAQIAALENEPEDAAPAKGAKTAEAVA